MIPFGIVGLFLFLAWVLTALADKLALPNCSSCHAPSMDPIHFACQGGRYCVSHHHVYRFTEWVYGLLVLLMVADFVAWAVFG